MIIVLQLMWCSPPLAHLHWWKEDDICKSIWDLFLKGDIGNMLRNIMKTWGTSWEWDGNPLRTWWEHIGNKLKMKKNPPYIPMSFLYQFLSSLRMLANIDFSIIMCIFRTLDQLFLNIYIYISPNFDLENMSLTHAKDFAWKKWFKFARFWIFFSNH